MNASSRREFMWHALSGCVLCGVAGALPARVLPTDLPPLLTSNYRPNDADEKGLWQACDDLEKQLAASKLRVTDPQINAYLLGVMNRLLGERAAELRLYLVRDPDFNASMAPNGMLLVHTGLLARMRSEAELAAVLGHESGHYLRRHTLQNWRRLKSHAATMSIIGIAGAFAGPLGLLAAMGVNGGVMMSLLSYSRELESEADAFGLQLIEKAGYPPDSAAEVWKKFIGERRASADERHKAYKDSHLRALSTHPPSEERMRDLTDTAAAYVEPAGVQPDARRDAWRQAIAPFRSALLAEQVGLNDPGASLYQIRNLAEDGWDGVLRFYEGEVYRLRGEPGDEALAAKAYAAAVEFDDAPPAALRQHGYALLRSGHNEDGQRALARYLELAPQAPDAEIVRFSIAH